MGFLSVLKTIGQDIEKGLAIAAPIVTTVDPPIGMILTEVAGIITQLESKGITVDPATLSQVISAVALHSAVKLKANPV